MDHWKNIPYFRLSPCFRTLRKNHNRRSVLPFCLRKNVTLSREDLIQKPLFWPLSNRLPAPGGGTTIYGLYRYVPLWRVWFSNRSLLWDRVYKSESLGLEYGIIFQEADQLFEDFSLDYKGNQELPLKNILKSNWFCFGCTALVTSVVSWKQVLYVRGGFREFTLV